MVGSGSNHAFGHSAGSADYFYMYTDGWNPHGHTGNGHCTGPAEGFLAEARYLLLPPNRRWSKCWKT